MVIGYSFGDSHVNNRILNAMVKNPRLKIVVVDPASKPWPEFLRQFDYDLRLRKVVAGATQWMSYVKDKVWDQKQTKVLKENGPIRNKIRQKVEVELTFI